MVTRERLESMRDAWVQLLERRAVPSDAARQLYGQLVALYSSPDRTYHNLEHLAEMFDVVERLAPFIHDADTVNLAVWFRDAFYDTRATDNEERSARLVCELLSPLGVPRPVIDRVAALVRSTEHLASANPPPDPDAAALLNADLAILGATPERYSRYARDIRLEYHWVPEPDYRRGRAAVLNAFLTRSRIFHHAIIHEEGEERARRNLLGELESLGPGSK
jgi:predicted metal-dependent HD superfamily phosphohydrolase